MALLGGTDAFCHILQLFFQAHMRGMHLYRSSKYTISNSNSFLQLLQLFHVKYRSADQAFLEWWYLCMKSLLWTCWGRVNLKLVFFSFYCNNKKGFILHCSISVLVMNSFFLTVVSYLWRFSVALRERSFFISPYLCYSSYLLHLNANRTKMRTIFKGKHFKNGKIERGGGAAPTKVSLLLSFSRICLPKVERGFLYLHISNQSCPKYENIEMSSVDCKYISNKFDIYNIRRKKIGAT